MSIKPPPRTGCTIWARILAWFVLQCSQIGRSARIVALNARYARVSRLGGGVNTSGIHKPPEAVEMGIRRFGSGVL